MKFWSAGVAPGVNVVASWIYSCHTRRSVYVDAVECLPLNIRYCDLHSACAQLALNWRSDREGERVRSTVEYGLEM